MDLQRQQVTLWVYWPQPSLIAVQFITSPHPDWSSY